MNAPLFQPTTPDDLAEREYTVLCPFGGLGGGALGFLNAEVRLLGVRARFRCLGGIDFSAEACADFEYLTKSRSLVADVAALSVAELRAFAGETAPDVVFLSPPCKGASGLLSAKKANTSKYRKMNRLTLDWMKVMLKAWPVPPRLVLVENVPRLKKRAARMLRAVRSMLHQAGYLFSDGFHDCGEIGGLAQYRRRYLLVARHQSRVPPLLYMPPKKRIRACGEVLTLLPVPATPEAAAAGPLHVLPRLSWLNWVRLALIPAGGDWRDLPNVLEKGEPRRRKFRRHHVQKWNKPSATVAGSGSNGPTNVADPRPDPGPLFNGAYGVGKWDEPAHTVTGESAPSNGTFAVQDPRVGSPESHFGNVDRVRTWDEPMGTVTASPAPSSGTGAVADPRVIGLLSCNPERHHNKYVVTDWADPSRTVIGATRPGSGAPSVADPRVVPADAFNGTYGVVSWDEPSGTITGDARPSKGSFAAGDPRPKGWFHNVYKVTPWTDPAGTVTTGGHPSTGAVSVADPRVSKSYDHGYAVLEWSEPSATIAAGSHPGQGAYSVGDPRLECTPRAGAYGVIPWTEAAKTVTGAAAIDNGSFAIADPRLPDAPPVIIVRDVKKAPSAVPVILSEDGTWHRPLTTLELAALQGLPTMVDGQPLRLTGTISKAREKIGNAVPPPAAQSMAEQMLVTLVHADAESAALGSTPVWVRRDGDYEYAELQPC